jgi:hypothetical protein
LVRKPDGQRPLRRHRHRRDDNTIMNFTERVCEGVD